MKKNMILSGILFTIMASGLNASYRDNGRKGMEYTTCSKSENRALNKLEPEDVMPIEYTSQKYTGNKKITIANENDFHAMQGKTAPANPTTTTTPQTDVILAQKNFPALSRK
jgi:hypothetical protein